MPSVNKLIVGAGNPEKAFGQLVQGKGNLISQAADFRELEWRSPSFLPILWTCARLESSILRLRSTPRPEVLKRL